MGLYLLYPSKSGYALFDCYGLFKIGEKKIRHIVNEADRFVKTLDLVAYYQFDSTEQNQIDAISQGVVTAELSNFLLLNLPKVEATKKPEFSLGVGEPNLCLNIFRATNIPCLCDSIVLQLLRGVELHINHLLDFPKVSIHYTVKRRKDDQMLLDTTNGDPFKFRLGTGQVIRALDMGICGMYAGGERRLTVPPSMGYETKGGRGTKGVIGPEGASGHWLVFNIRLVDADF